MPDKTQTPPHADALAAQRDALRRHYRQRRAQLDPKLRQAANRAVCRHLIEFVTSRQARTVAAYAATATEVDLSDWIHAHRQHEGIIALPRVMAAGTMDFYALLQPAPTHRNRYGIAEPEPTAPQLDPSALDLALVPLVAFDANGQRLGMGGGYYDRYLPRLRPQTLIVGVAYQCQYAAAPLPHAAWDVRLHAVVTETGVLECPPHHAAER